MLALIAANIVVVVTVVLIHYEFLARCSSLMSRLATTQRFRLALGVLGALAPTQWKCGYSPSPTMQCITRQAGATSKATSPAVCSTAATAPWALATSSPIGALRYLAGIEALTGLVLITWTASFLFLEMQRYWSAR